jgi:hypothetical protein
MLTLNRKTNCMHHYMKKAIGRVGTLGLKLTNCTDIILRICLSSDYVMSLMMSSKKASLVTVSSLLRLCNGCCSRHVVNCIKGTNTSRAICTAAKRWGFRFSGGYHADDSSDYQQNRAGLYYNQRASGSSRYKHASSNSSYKGTLEELDSFCSFASVGKASYSCGFAALFAINAHLWEG